MLLACGGQRPRVMEIPEMHRIPLHNKELSRPKGPERQGGETLL